MSEFSERRSNLLKEIKSGVAILHAGDEQEIFIPNSDFYYLTGLSEPDIIALLSPIHGYILFAPPVDSQKKVWVGPQTSLEELKDISGADLVVDRNDFFKELPKYLESSQYLHYSLGKNSHLDSQIITILNRERGKPKITPMAIWELGEITGQMRLHKSPQELKWIKKAIEITEQAYRQVFAKAKPGMYEHEIEAILNYHFRKEGGNGCAFPSIVGSGANATFLHYVKNNCQISENSLVLVDSGARYNYYCADVTRTWPISGKFTPAQQAVYDVVLEAQKFLISEISPGKEVIEWRKQATKKLSQGLLDLKLLKGDLEEIIKEKKYQKYYPHSIGHWLGLDVHDIGGLYYQRKVRTFAPDMVLTVEPGLYIPKDDDSVPEEFRGIGVRIEDDILVTKTSCEILTTNIPKLPNSHG